MNRDSERETTTGRTEAPIGGRSGLTMSQAGDFLRRGKIKGCNMLPSGSNYVFVVDLTRDKIEGKAIYKPRQGETPLWDFPTGTLYKREYAAFQVSQALGWGLIPPTIIREGPYGIGSMQWFIETISETGTSMRIPKNIMKRVALFDYLVNNADRKAGHFLVDEDRRLWLVDHGLTFNAVPKLRTVLWDFAGQAVPADLLADVKLLQSQLKPSRQLRDFLLKLLTEPEMAALDSRIEAILDKPVFVYPGPHRSVPWPWY